VGGIQWEVSRSIQWEVYSGRYPEVYSGRYTVGDIQWEVSRGIQSTRHEQFTMAIKVRSKAARAVHNGDQSAQQGGTSSSQWRSKCAARGTSSSQWRSKCAARGTSSSQWRSKCAARRHEQFTMAIKVRSKEAHSPLFVCVCVCVYVCVCVCRSLFWGWGELRKMDSKVVGALAFFVCKHACGNHSRCLKQ